MRVLVSSTSVVGAVVGLALALTRGSEDEGRKLNTARATGAQTADPFRRSVIRPGSLYSTRVQYNCTPATTPHVVKHYSRNRLGSPLHDDASKGQTVIPNLLLLLLYSDEEKVADSLHRTTG